MTLGLAENLIVGQKTNRRRSAYPRTRNCAVKREDEPTTLKMYDIDLPGRNHGLLVGTHGWIAGPAD
ncbi:MAG: hypothetical protein WAQ33_14350 [Gaiellaceae bacterium]